VRAKGQLMLSLLRVAILTRRRVPPLRMAVGTSRFAVELHPFDFAPAGLIRSSE
jgi:hypothetical protein